MQILLDKFCFCLRKKKYDECVLPKSMVKFTPRNAFDFKNKQLMGRSIPKNISNHCKIVHESNGNNIYLNTTIKDIIPKQSNCKVTLSNNKVIEVDLIIVGIGSIPNTELFSQKKIEINNGIKTNEFCETSQKNVYAAGDISNFFHPFYKKNIRLESFLPAHIP